MIAVSLYYKRQYSQMAQNERGGYESGIYKYYFFKYIIHQLILVCFQDLVRWQAWSTVQPQMELTGSGRVVQLNWDQHMLIMSLQTWHSSKYYDRILFKR